MLQEASFAPISLENYKGTENFNPLSFHSSCKIPINMHIFFIFFYNFKKNPTLY